MDRDLVNHIRTTRGSQSKERDFGPHPGDPDGSRESIFVYTLSHSEGQLSLGDSGTEANTPSLELKDRAVVVS